MSGGSWLGVVRTASGGVLRHKAQSVVIGMVLLVSTASATLGLALLSASSAPFDHAFNAQRGAHVVVTVNATRATAAQLAATRSVTGVTAMAGPFPLASVSLDFQGQPFGQLGVAGRADQGGPVDDLVLNAGHWLTGPGQVVLGGTPDVGQPDGWQVGDVLTAPGLPGKPSLTVVGFANSITSTAQAWVTPGEALALQAANLKAAAGHGPVISAPAGKGPQPIAATDTTPQDLLLYRFASAAGYPQIHTDITAVSRALPSGSYLDAASWLTAQQQATGNGAIMEPFVVAFALIGLVMAVLIVGNVVSGAVIAQFHRIGVLKSIGMRPGQVITVYLSRIGWPALAGCLLGVIAGNVLAIPVMHQSANAYGVGSQQVPWWASAVAFGGMLGLTMLAALGPALRAGRLSANQAIAAGRAPRSGSGYAAHRLAARFRLPRPVSLGLAAPFARPARTVVTLAAIAFGATAVIFAVGLNASLGRAAAGATLSATVPVRIQQYGPGAGPQQAPSAAQFAAMTAALRDQPGTAHSVTVYGTQISVPGAGQNVLAQAFSGDASWTGYAMIAGRWYRAPGEVDVNTAFLTQSGLSVGDTALLRIGPAQVPARIVGEVFQATSEPRVYGSTRTLPGVASLENYWQTDVGLRPGTSPAAYLQAVNARLGSGSPFAARPPEGGKFFTVASALISTLALMVAIAAALGVLNTVLMTTRDRVHDLGVFKALGMRPGQIITMVICWIAGPAVIAGVIAAPAAMVLNTATLNAMAATAHTGIPASFARVFGPGRLALLSLAALGIAVIGALLPAAWAARSRAATALRAE